MSEQGPGTSRKQGLGIDIGGTGIKGAIVDLDTGELLTERIRFETPAQSTPQNVADVVAKIVEETNFSGEIGVAFPAVIQHGVAKTAANIDKSWIGVDIGAVMSERLGMPTEVINDADAAGIAEMHYGAGVGHQKGLVLMLTFGTGIGSALFNDGLLIPNTEFGHIELNGEDGEKYAAGSVKDREGIRHREWADRVSHYLQVLERGLWPELIIVGGGISKKADKWVPYLENRSPVAVAKLLNNAGIVGAAYAAARDLSY